MGSAALNERWARIVAGVLTLAVAVALFVVLSPDADEGEEAGSAARQGQLQGSGEPGVPDGEQEPGGSPGARTEPAPGGTPEVRAGSDAQVPEVVVRDGRPVGGPIEVEATRGERIVFDVRSDAAEEIHVHGYDITREIPAGGAARVSFKADLEGVYEAELHGSGAPVAELTVKPG